MRYSKKRAMHQVKFLFAVWAVLTIGVLGLYIETHKYQPPTILVAHAETLPKAINVVVDYTKIPKGQILDAIAKCESGNDYGAQARGSSAFGAYQITKDTFADANRNLGGQLSILNPTDQDLAAAWLLDHRGLAPWLETKGCWSKTIGKNPNF